MRQPKNTAPMTIDRMYMTSVRKPRPLRMTRMLAMLHAGPAMRSTSAAPGVSPFSMSTTAIGIDPVAHRYIGMDMMSTRIIDAMVLSLNIVNTSSGT